MGSTDLLISFRGALREYVENEPGVIWSTLVLFFAIFLLRLLLRSDCLAGAAFTALFVGAAGLGGSTAIDILFTVIVYASFAFVAIRFGLLAVAAMLLFDRSLGDMPASFVVMVLACAAAILWAFVQSIRRQRLGAA